ncbi:MAG: sialate O-acetylesterase [Sphingobacteriaceae bacterium]|nr:sialate O-acetylesterase [Sphingobacteriaceae bacterium]
MRLRTYALSVLLLLPAILVAEVKPNTLFSDHMVLQQGVKVPVWGTANEGENVIIEFGTQKVSAVTRNGKWLIVLNPLKQGGPFSMKISGENTVEIKDILVGEVWICGGQSNMERQLGPRPPQKPILGWEKAVAEAQYPQIREFFVPHITSPFPLTEIDSKWVVCSPQTVKEFSAVGYFFARDLHARLKVPVGMIFSSWGGTPAENWTRKATLESNPELLTLAQNYDNAMKEYPAKLAGYQKDEPQLLEKWKTDTATAKRDKKPLPRKPAPPADPAKSGAAGNMYNAMIASLQPYAVKGVIWYQGESNQDRAKQYQTLFPVMINDWRNAWGGNQFPFLFVQIAPFNGMKPEIREAQLLSWQKTPNTAMVVTTDLGDATDIHPANKEPVGARLALAARALAYKDKIVYSGPVFKEVKFMDGKARLKFDFTGSGLISKGGELKGFTIAGNDKVFVPARAEIKGKQIIVFNDTVTDPKAVRFGWANAPEVNLFNKEGLPASPFRTDID